MFVPRIDLSGETTPVSVAPRVRSGATRRLLRLRQCLHRSAAIPKTSAQLTTRADAAHEPGRFPGWPDASVSKAQAMPTLSPLNNVDAASTCYRHSGYLVLRDTVPAELLAELQTRFEHHTTKIIQERGELWRNYGRRFQIDELKDDPAFVQLAEHLTRHPVIQRLAQDMWHRTAVITSMPYGSLHPAGEASNQSWHNDARLPDREGVNLIPFLIRASVLLDTVTEDMGPTALLPGSHGTRDSPPGWAHTAQRQPMTLPGMQTFTGEAGDVLLNDVSIWHASTPNLSEQPRKLMWLLWGPGLT